MDEQRAETNEPKLRRPDEMIVDFEPDEKASEQVKGGDGYLKIEMNDTRVSS